MKLTYSHLSSILSFLVHLPNIFLVKSLKSTIPFDENNLAFQPRPQGHLRFQNGARHFESGEGPGDEVVWRSYRRL